MPLIHTQNWDSVQTSRCLSTVKLNVTALSLLAMNCGSLVCWNTISQNSKCQENWACVVCGGRHTPSRGFLWGTYLLGKDFAWEGWGGGGEHLFR